MHADLLLIKILISEEGPGTDDDQGSLYPVFTSEDHEHADTVICFIFDVADDSLSMSLKSSGDLRRAGSTGSQFISERTRKFCNERGIKLITSTPRYPQSNGLAESSNKTIINSIRKRLKAAKGRWVEELPSVLWANRTTPRTSTGQTPFSLVYGCEAVLPIESQVPVARHRTIEQNSIDLCYDIDALEELRDKAFQRMASQKAMIERYFNKKVKVKVFQVGDHVLRRVFPNTQESNARKLSIKWEGPYVISKVVGKGAYKITTIEGSEIPRS
ncbi:hypothetical protein OSB04_013528 [Centaurea solstitialis]|uniref:Integrase catalytic domain-containing protein n=1 Tax=Centaurea solstitialis TaxID=347529 RepID=A0AA38TDH8_9ASTR|nr:hypothetical protein OSB04_013528 [Centaurea solstitialis]